MCEVFKIVNDIGLFYPKNITINDRFYETRTVMPLVLPIFRSVRYGKRNLRYEGALLFRGQIVRWDGPACQCHLCLVVVTCEAKSART